MAIMAGGPMGFLVQIWVVGVGCVLFFFVRGLFIFVCVLTFVRAFFVLVLVVFFSGWLLALFVLSGCVIFCFCWFGLY